MVNQAIDPLDSRESTEDLANMLTYLDSAEGLAELQLVPGFTSVRLNRATRLLSLEWQRKIREWALENRRQRESV